MASLETLTANGQTTRGEVNAAFFRAGRLVGMEYFVPGGGWSWVGELDGAAEVRGIRVPVTMVHTYTGWRVARECRPAVAGSFRTMLRRHLAAETVYAAQCGITAGLEAGQALAVEAGVIL